MRLPRRFLAVLLGMAVLLSMAVMPASAAAPRQFGGGNTIICHFLSFIDSALDRQEIPDSDIDSLWSRLCD